MEQITEWRDLSLRTLNEMGESIASALPSILGVIMVLVVGWLLIRMILYVLRKTLKFIKVDRLNNTLNGMDLIKDSEYRFDIGKTLLWFVKWILYLVIFIIAADIMGWEIVSREIGNLLRYLPQLLSAVAIFMIGLYIAGFIRKAIAGLFDSLDLAGSRLVSNLVFYIIAVILSVTALDQAGIDTTIITNNITVILGAFLLSVALALGLGSTRIVADILRTYYTRRNFEPGNRVRIGDTEGVVLGVDNMSMTLQTKTGRIIFPIREVADSRVEVLVPPEEI